MTGNIRRILSACRKRSIIQTTACNLNLRNRSVFTDHNSIRTSLSGKCSSMCMAMPENVIRTFHLNKSAMVISCVIDRKCISFISNISVGYDHTLIFKRTFRCFCHSIAKFMPLQTGINKIIPVPKMTDAGRFKKRMCFISRSFRCIDSICHAYRFTDNGVHIIRKFYHHRSRNV